ncbi:MAG: glutamate--tRNA ligase [Candidatus Omnitrophica bacterium]|nr:glutamate--tRNA ligase [Candidatus Omnitrophota bacterium]
MRVRFAPSPTGFLHIGNARTALFNYLLAAHNKGEFILRIEDTDRERSKPEYIEQIFKDLGWLGIRWTEGPDIGGKYGPYLQSERTKFYKDYVKKLIDEGKAYYCYCTPEELDKDRQEQLAQGLTPKYSNKCRTLSDEEMAEKHRAGILPSVRFKVEGAGELTVDDMIRDEVTFALEQVGDFIIMRPDTTPTFHFAVAVDDGLMGITHVVRGEDHLTNTPKHILIMKACGFKVPRYAHMPLTMGPGGEPLSKRLGAMSIHEYRKLGYRSEALCNYMALLGWSPGDDRELFTLNELKEHFSIKRVSKSPAVFDKAKLDWVSGMHIRQMDENEFAQEILAFALDEKIISEEDYNTRPEWYAHILRIFRNNLSCYSEIKEKMQLFDTTIEYEDAELLKSEGARSVIAACEAILQEIDVIDENTVDNFLKSVKKRSGQKGKELFAPLRMAFTGKMHGPDLKEVMIILGRRGCLKRVQTVLYGEAKNGEGT